MDMTLWINSRGQKGQNVSNPVKSKNHKTSQGELSILGRKKDQSDSNVGLEEDEILHPIKIY
jgi:hypothetical protein